MFKPLTNWQAQQMGLRNMQITFGEAIHFEIFITLHQKKLQTNQEFLKPA